MTIDPRITRLHEILDPLGDLIVACSGGVDSSLLLKIAFDRARETGRRVIGVLGHSASVAELELLTAHEIAERIGVELREIETGEMADPRYAANPDNRCFYCKDDLYTRLTALAREEGFATVIDGANADDAGDYRPGMAAARLHGVRSPLMEAGLTKTDVRDLSRLSGLPTWDKPSAPCLSSRIAYGDPITPEKLRRIEKGEQALRGLGFPVVRLRTHGEVARIEVPAEEIERLASMPTRGKVAKALRELGFTFIAIDAEGFLSGNLNRSLKLKGSGRD